MGDLARAGLRQRRGGRVRVELVDGAGQAGEGRMAMRTASQVHSSSTASCRLSINGSHLAMGMGAGVTSSVSGWPSRSRMCTWKCGAGPSMVAKLKA